MKKLSLILSLCFVVSITFAQKKEKTPEVKAAKSTAKMTKNLDLTPDQQVRVKEIYLKKYTQKAELKAEKKATKTAKAQKTVKKYVNAEFDRSLNEILTDEQKVKRAAIKSEKKKKAKMKMQKGKVAKAKAAKAKRAKVRANMTPEQIQTRSSRATDRLDKQVSLNPEQKAKAHSIHVDYYTKSAELGNMQVEDRTVLRDKRKAINKDFQAAINNMFTEEQRAMRKAAKAKKKHKKQLKQNNQQLQKAGSN